MFLTRHGTPFLDVDASWCAERLFRNEAGQALGWNIHAGRSRRFRAHVAISTVMCPQKSSENCIQAHIHSTNTLPHINVYFSERQKCTTRGMSRSGRLVNNFFGRKKNERTNVLRTLQKYGGGSSFLLGGMAGPCTGSRGRLVDTSSGPRHVHWTDFEYAQPRHAFR